MIKKEAHKGQLISECPFGVIVWTKIPTKFLMVSALVLSGQKLCIKFFAGGPNEDFKKTF